MNYKVIDKVGHRYSCPSRQMATVVRAVDQALGDLVGTLDRVVGAGQWVLGSPPTTASRRRPETTGAVVIDNVELARDLQRTFDGAMQAPRPTQTWVTCAAPATRPFARGGGPVPDGLHPAGEHPGGAGPSGQSGERAVRRGVPSSVLPTCPASRRTGLRPGVGCPDTRRGLHSLQSDQGGPMSDRAVCDRILGGDRRSAGGDGRERPPSPLRRYDDPVPRRSASPARATSGSRSTSHSSSA